jgi:hypothetical protein
MKQKDLSLVYALKEYARVNGKGGPIIEDNRCFTLDDIKAAFNAGRERVVESMPKLKFKKTYKGGHSFATTPFGFSYEIYLNFDEFDVFCDECIVVSCQSLKEAKQAANENYKKRIKQALGL